MAGANTSNVSGILKNIYDNYVIQMQNLKARAIDEIVKSSKNYNAAGKGFFGAINDYGNESVGALNESETFRTIDSEHYQQWKVTPKVLVAPIQFSGLLAKSAEGDQESFANAVVRELDMAKERLRADQNRQFYGAGKGTLAKVKTATLSTDSEVEVDSTQYLRDNMVVDIFRASTKTIDSARITKVNRATGKVTVSAPLGTALAVDDEIVKENVRDSAPSDGKEMMGLRGIVDDGTDLATFQDISVASTPVFSSRRINASGASLTSDLLQLLEDDVALVSGDEIDMLIMHRKQRRKYLELVTPDKRFHDLNMDAGFSKLTFNGKELWLDKDCQVDTVYGIKKSELRKFELAPMGLAGHEGSDKYLRLSNQDAYQTYWVHYCNLGTGKRNAHGKIVGLSVPTGIA